jgi:hypothetical protein
MQMKVVSADSSLAKCNILSPKLRPASYYAKSANRKVRTHKRTVPDALKPPERSNR